MPFEQERGSTNILAIEHTTMMFLGDECHPEPAYKILIQGKKFSPCPRDIVVLINLTVHVICTLGANH